MGAVLGSIARRRTGFVVAFGFDGGLQAASGGSFVSPRRIPADREEMLTVLEGAVAERPDALVFLSDGRLPGADAIVAAATGRLVLVGVVARSAPHALESLLNDAADRHVRPWATSLQPPIQNGPPSVVRTPWARPGEYEIESSEEPDLPGRHHTVRKVSDAPR